MSPTFIVALLVLMGHEIFPLMVHAGNSKSSDSRDKPPAGNSKSNDSKDSDKQYCKKAVPKDKDIAAKIKSLNGNRTTLPTCTVSLFIEITVYARFEGTHYRFTCPQIGLLTLSIQFLHSSMALSWNIDDYIISSIFVRGVNPGGLRVSRPPDFGQGGHRGRRGVAEGVVGTGREILLYLIMYWNFIRKWWLLKRNRIIYPEVAVNEQVLPGKSIFLDCLKISKLFKNLPGKIEIFQKCAWKSKFFKNLP